jgi:hypothetical protein
MDMMTKDTLTIKEFAKTIDAKQMHEVFYIDKKNNHETFNQAYSTMLRFKMFDYYDYSDFDEPKYTSFRNAFISALINRAGEIECIDFSNQFNQYNHIIQKLKYDDMIELWKNYLNVKSHTTKTIENPEQQTLINAFKSYETGDLFTDINKINDTILRMYLKGDADESFIYYRTYLMTCVKKQDSYGVKYVPDGVKAKFEFHKFNVWLDEYYKKNKLNNQRLLNEEKMFYLYLLKEVNDICDAFPTYFQGEIDINWWGLDEYRSKSLKQSKAYLDSKNIT